MTRRFPRHTIPTAARIVLVVLASLRMSRFFTSDWLGEWMIGERAKEWAYRHEAVQRRRWYMALPHPKPAFQEIESPEHLTWQAKLVKGLDCPFCVGFWVGVLIILGELILGRMPLIGRLWHIILAALGMNYVVGHVSAKID